MTMSLNRATEKDVFLKLKSSSASVVYDGLLEIRSSVIKTREGLKCLRENLILRDLVKFLDKPNEKILDVTLSILGNCCLDKDCRNEVVGHGVTKLLASVINNVGKDSIQCRACRLVANLAQESDIAELLHKEEIVESIVTLLAADSNSSRATQQMAVRALRMLWGVENQREKMLNLRAVNAVAMLLAVSPDKVEEDFLQAVVKAVVAFTSYHTEECAQQVQGNGSGFQHLVALVANSKLKYLTIECICNLCLVSSSRPALGNLGIVKLIIKELSENNLAHTGHYTQLVMALCYLCRESVNRAKIRRAGGLPLILRIMQNSSSTHLRSLVLHALIQFVYDETSLLEMLKEGLVPILVNKIATFVKEYGKEHTKSSVRPEFLQDSPKGRIFTNNIDTASDAVRQNSFSRRGIFKVASVNNKTKTRDNEQEHRRPRFRANSPSYQAVVQEQGSSLRNRSPDMSCRDASPELSPRGCYMSGDVSPLSMYSMCLSPDSGVCSAASSDGLSPPCTPPSYSAIADDIDCQEVYSPICFDGADDDDDDDDCEIECSVLQDSSEDKTSDSVTKSESSSCSSKQEDLRTEVSKSSDNELDAVLILLSRISHMETPVEELAAHSTFTALLDYMTLIADPQPRASRTLFRIIRNHHYFMAFILQEFVLTVQARLCQPQHSACWLCSEFTSLGLSLFAQVTMYAHSGFGEGELAHHLLKGEESVKKLLSVSIPYIVRIQRILCKLMVECNALRILVQILDNYSTENDKLLKFVPVSLQLLANALDVPNPHHPFEDVHDHDDKYPYHLGKMDTGPMTVPNVVQACDDVISLLLDDGNSVQISRNYLSSQSPVFEAMFRGGFKESSEDRISLPGISHSCLINLLRVMKLGHVPLSFPDIDLSTSLELAAVLDRFLMPGSEQVTDMIVNRFLSTSTATEIYNRCVEAGDVSHFHNLRYNTVRFLLTSNACSGRIDEMFKEFLQSSHKKQLLTDITDILQERLSHVPCTPRYSCVTFP
ncbi:armadillo repeat-containing protein 5 [Periplaneta americana]|uniref:armadillo repeat-containing protein 5 n=1 Tax=Periplaneta americana TaxID=6978 RepID=UPI0037E78462